MIIPTFKKEKYDIGDVIINLTLFKYKYLTFTLGEEFTVIGYNFFENRKTDICEYILKISGLEIIIQKYEVNNFTLKIDEKIAKKIYDDNCKKNHILDFIKNQCKYKYLDIDHYDTYDACKIKNYVNKYTYCPCDVKFECLQYFDKSQYENDDIVKNYIRENKIKQING